MILSEDPSARNFSFAASGRPGVGYEALSQGAQAPGPGAQDGDQTTYLQQLRQWLQPDRILWIFDAFTIFTIKVPFTGI